MNKPKVTSISIAVHFKLPDFRVSLSPFTCYISNSLLAKYTAFSALVCEIPLLLFLKFLSFLVHSHCQ